MRTVNFGIGRCPLDNENTLSGTVKNMKREFSAGGIVFNKNREVLLINNAAMRDPKKSYWGFPKGHINEGESSKDAAIREVKEETGIEVDVIEKIGDSKYVFTVSGEKIFKVVIMFLMRYASGEIKIQEEELLGAEWVSVEDAQKKLSFPKDRQLLGKAVELIKN
jgi:8-oxo-dGTP diphosphatase